MLPHLLELCEMAHGHWVDEHDIPYQALCAWVLHTADRICPNESADMFGHKPLCVAIEVEEISDIVGCSGGAGCWRRAGCWRCAGWHGCGAMRCICFCENGVRVRVV